MAKYLDEAGLSTLWKKIKGTFVAQIIKKSDSSNATQITHNGDTVSLSRGTISGTGNTSIYTASTSIDIGADDMITFTSTSRPQYRVEENTDLIPMAFLRDIPSVDTALSSTSTNPVQNKVIFTALNNKLNTSDFNAMKGVTNGLATLDSTGKVPSSQLPSYVDDVIEGYYYNSKFYKEESHTNEIAGESGKIYTDLGNNKTYRWSGTTYTEISASLALGETSSTAYPGNKGAANATNIANNATNIGHLQGYFDNGKAIYAINDASGNVITETYAKKSDLSSVAQNASAKIDKSVLTAKGDIIYASAASTPAKLAIGANGKVLKVVNGIPAWSDDNNTTYSAGNGISLNGTTFSLNTSYENNGRNYAVLVDSNKNLYVNVPWVNTTDHSHSNKALLDSFEGAIPDSAINALS